VVLWAWAVAGAEAAEVRTDAGCYRPGDDVRLTASGFAPGSVFAALLDGRRLGGGLVEQGGAIQAAFPAPALRRGRREERHAVGILDAAGGAATATFAVSVPSARVSPRPRDPRAATVRFLAYGMGAGRAVTLTWLDPSGRARRTATLGRAEGPCGRITTRRRRLLPFAPRPGTWQLRVRSSGGPQVVLRVRVSRST
jgi:hypothetical protein